MVRNALQHLFGAQVNGEIPYQLFGFRELFVELLEEVDELRVCERVQMMIEVREVGIVAAFIQAADEVAQCMQLLEQPFLRELDVMMAEAGAEVAHRQEFDEPVMHVDFEVHRRCARQ